MKTNVKTESGSLYEIDNEAKTWERIEETKKSGRLRTDSGDLSADANAKLGEPLIILGPPIAPYTWGRIIMTTNVVEITHTK